MRAKKGAKNSNEMLYSCHAVFSFFLGYQPLFVTTRRKTQYSVQLQGWLYTLLSVVLEAIVFSVKLLL